MLAVELHTVAVVVEQRRAADKAEEIDSGSRIAAVGGSRILFDPSRFSFEHEGSRDSGRRTRL